MTEATKPSPIAIEDVAWTEWSDVPRFGVRYRHLSRAALGDGYRIGVAIEELPPGMQAAPAHFHMREEEHLFMLEGRLTVRLGEAEHVMTAGDYIVFPAGQKIGHSIVNETDSVCRYVIIGENDPDDVIVYTDSRKVLVRALGRRALFDLDATRGYWDGERTGLAGDSSPPGDVAEIDIDTAAAPLLPIHADDVPWEDSHRASSFGGRARHLTHAAMGDHWHVGVLIESPDPGKRLAPLHYHMREEEHALILEGEAMLLLGDERYPMKAGDYVAFAAGRKLGHAMMNSGPGPLRYLMIGERNPSDVCIYPQSDKMAVNALDVEANIFGMSPRRRYWDGET